MNAMLSPATSKGVDKTKRYGWRTIDQAGHLTYVPKVDLAVNHDYQRDVIPGKVTEITAAFSWLAFGALIVAERQGRLYVVDGQHRLAAVMRRSDIDVVPCIIFPTEDISSEARAFLASNTLRKQVSAAAKHRAGVVAGDEQAAFVQGVVQSLGLEIVSSAKSPGKIACVALCRKLAADDRQAFADALKATAELCTSDEMHVHEILLGALYLIHTRCGDGLRDRRLSDRLKALGAKGMLIAATRAAQAYARGGAKVWAEGILREVNHGLRNKFVLTNKEAA